MSNLLPGPYEDNADRGLDPSIVVAALDFARLCCQSQGVKIFILLLHSSYFSGPSILST